MCMCTCMCVKVCGVTAKKREFYERYHETEYSGRTGHLKKIGEEVEVQ